MQSRTASCGPLAPGDKDILTLAMASTEVCQEFERARAAELVPNVPTPLESLCFHRRSPQGPTVRLYAVGDIGLSGRVRKKAGTRGFEALFRQVAPCLKSGDIVFGNLECVLQSHFGPGKPFAAPRSAAEALAHVGFKVLHLANNHALDHGPASLSSTLDVLERSEIKVLGAGPDVRAARQVVRTDANDLRIGWLGTGRTLLKQPESGPRFWEFDEEQLLQEVERARETLDALVVSLHIGYMYLDYPHPDHKALAARLAAAGADLVLMHHAHVLQGVEVTEAGAVICYSLGNFLLDYEEGNVETRTMIREQTEGGVFVFDLDRGGVALAAVLPTVIAPDAQVRWARGVRGRRVLERLQRISLDFQGDYSQEFWRQRALRNTELTLRTLWFLVSHGRLSDLLALIRRMRLHHLAMAVRWVLSFRGASSK